MFKKEVMAKMVSVGALTGGGGEEGGFNRAPVLLNFSNAASAIGVAIFQFPDIVNDKVQLFGNHTIIGRSVVVHASRDDLGTGAGTSLTNGNSGVRIGCGVIVDMGICPGRPATINLRCVDHCALAMVGNRLEHDFVIVNCKYECGICQ
ncbi:copper/zinc superoxide dismutase (SODC) domain-containing protein [Ditylenchus destructor]|nr:copper/zinc superoxide dismutase (SODC) domain-containing protein [Ditylenchus destructor]